MNYQERLKQEKAQLKIEAQAFEDYVKKTFGDLFDDGKGTYSFKGHEERGAYRAPIVSWEDERGNKVFFKTESKGGDLHARCRVSVNFCWPLDRGLHPAPITFSMTKNEEAQRNDLNRRILMAFFIHRETAIAKRDADDALIANQVALGERMRDKALETGLSVHSKHEENNRCFNVHYNAPGVKEAAFDTVPEFKDSVIVDFRISPGGYYSEMKITHAPDAFFEWLNTKILEEWVPKLRKEAMVDVQDVAAALGVGYGLAFSVLDNSPDDFKVMIDKDKDSAFIPQSQVEKAQKAIKAALIG